MTTNKALLFFDKAQFLVDLTTENHVKVFRNAISAANTHLDNRFHEGEDVQTLVRERSEFMDEIILLAWNRHPWDKHIALLAVGGYGRGELHPHSDIDLMVLIRRGNPARYQQKIADFFTFLWDIQLKIGHSVRSLSQCVEEARLDITVATNLMETRTIDGDDKLRQSMIIKTGPRKIWPSKKFFTAKLKEQNLRHHKFGYNEYSLEPNIKEAPGGLRDIQMINWVARRHFIADTMAELVGKDFLTGEEYMQLKRDEAFLWKVRYGLHLIAGRPQEVLDFDSQRKLAKMLGYQDTEKRLAVEQMMQHYYQVVLSIRELNDVMLQYLDEVILHKDKAKSIAPLNERFQIRDQYIETAGEHIFAQYPSALLEIFCLLAEREDIIGIRAATIRQIRQYRRLITDSFLNNPQNKELFLRLLSSPNQLGVQLQRMTRYGILGRYLPEFGKIIGQTQHDLFHRYPVDAHTLLLIKNMHRFDQSQGAEEFPLCAHIYNNLPKPELLYIAALYHDIAKGRGGDHSTLGAVDAADFCRRHNLPEEETRLVAWLVEHHLLLSSTSQRSDVSDPDVIHKFARIIGDQIKLDYLYVLTVADITATNPTLWNSWKDSLMRQLYTETRRALERGLESAIDRKVWGANIKRTALNMLASNGITEEEALAIWGGLDDESFTRERPENLARFTTAIHHHDNPAEPLILIEDVGAGTPVATRIFIHTQQLSNVFPIVAATLDQLRLNILDAKLSTNPKGNTYDSFFALDEDAQTFGDNPEQVKKIQLALAHALTHPTESTFEVHRHTPRHLKSFTLQTVAMISNDINKNATMLEVITPDRPGLLAHLGRIFMRFGLRLLSAKIATLGERVEDMFYVVDHDYQPLSDPATCELLSETICRELDERNREDVGGKPLRQMKLLR